MKQISALLVLLVLSFYTQADQLDQFVDRGQLKLKSWIEPDRDIVVNQQVKLYIQVATDTWFGGGTRIQLFNIDNAIVLKPDKFAVNGTERDKGKTWTTQRWSFTVFPAKAGIYEIPGIEVDVSISGSSREIFEGRLKTDPIQFEVSLPVELAGIDDWVASPEYSIVDEFDRDLEGLTPGDVISRTTTLTASDVPAMLLPELFPDSFAGVAAYKDPPRLDDRQNRGTYIASRIEQTSYVIEKSGKYEFPEQRFYWWNTETGNLEEIVLDSTTFEVGKGTWMQRIKYSDVVKKYGIDTLLVCLLAVILALAIAGFLIRRWLARKPGRCDKDKAIKLFEQLEKDYSTACMQSNTAEVVQLLYKRLGLNGTQADTRLLKEYFQRYASVRELSELDDLLNHVYSMNDRNSVDLNGLKNLINKTRPSRFSNWQPKLKPVELKLN